MAASQDSWIRTVYLSGATGPVAAGKCLVKNAAGSRYVVSTAANRAAAGRRTAGISLTAGDNEDVAVQIQYVGEVPSSITGLGAGTASLIRVSSTGTLERVGSYSSSDDVCGHCDTDGSAYVCFPLVGITLSGANPGGSNGDVQIRSGASTLSGVSPGTSGNVLTSNGSSWTSATPASATTVAAGDGVRVTGSLPSLTVHGVKDTCSLEQFGAVGNGVASDNTAMAAAITALGAGTYKTLVLAANKTYLVTATHTVPAGCSVVGQGSSSIIKTATDAAVLVVGGEDVLLRDFQILGSGTGSSQVGIKIGTAASSASGFSHVTIRGIYFNDLGADGLQYNQNPFTTYAGPRVSDCIAESCATGFRCGTRGEYITFTGCQAESCTTGLYVGAGNVSWVGGSITSCVTAVQLATGTNDAHGTVIGAFLNHNTTSVLAGAITNGHTFTGCHLYEGAISATSASGLRFVGGQIDVTSYTADGCIVSFENVSFPGSYANTISEPNSGACRFPGARTLASGLPSFIGNRQTGAFVSGSEVFLGTDPLYTGAQQASAFRLYCNSAGYGYLGTGNTATAYWSSADFNFQQPITIDGGSGTMATGGLIRTKPTVTSILQAGTKTILGSSTTDVWFGGDSSYANQFNNLRIYGATLVAIGLANQNSIEVTSGLTTLKAGGNNGLHVTTAKVGCVVPVAGSSGDSVPFRWKHATITYASANVTATAAQYECPYLSITGSGPGSGTLDLVLPNSDGAFFIVAVSTSSGSWAPLLKKSGGAGVAAPNNTQTAYIHNGSDYSSFT